MHRRNRKFKLFSGEWFYRSDFHQETLRGGCSWGIETGCLAHAVHTTGGALQYCWGFIHGTVRPVYRLVQMKRAIYNSHIKVHYFKFQSVAAPTGMIANPYGLVEWRRRNSNMLARSALLQQSKSTNVPIWRSSLPTHCPLADTFHSKSATNS